MILKYKAYITNDEIKTESAFTFEYWLHKTCIAVIIRQLAVHNVDSRNVWMIRERSVREIGYLVKPRSVRCQSRSVHMV